MSASMRPVVLAMARSRLPLPLVPLVGGVLLRASHDGPMDWRGSDLQGILAVIVYLAIVPMLSIVLATGWLRGEVGPWSWSLARPIARWRWLATTLLVDVATLLVAVAVSRLVVDELPNHWIGPWPGDGTRELGYLALLTIVHCGAAFAGARGASAIGGALHAVGFVAIALLAHVAAVVAGTLALGARLKGPGVLRRLRHELLNLWQLDDPLSVINTLAPALFVATAAGIVAARVGGRLPARPRLRATTPLGLAILGAAAFAATTTTVVMRTLLP